MAAGGIEEAGRLWAAGRPLEAGRLLTALVPPEQRPGWAGRVLAWAYDRSRVPPVPEVVAVIAATRDLADREGAAAAHRAVGEALQRAERSGRFDSLAEAMLVLAQGAARLVLEASSDAPDAHTGWWFVASVKCVGDVVDNEFTVEAWPVLAQLE